MSLSLTVQRLRSKIARFVRSEDGPTAVEYAVMLSLIVIVCMTAIQSIGTNARTSFQRVSTSLQGAS
jgi:pilus assembly protein Flp/PilA